MDATLEEGRESALEYRAIFHARRFRRSLFFSHEIENCAVCGGVITGRSMSVTHWHESMGDPVAEYRCCSATCGREAMKRKWAGL